MTLRLPQYGQPIVRLNNVDLSNLSIDGETEGDLIYRDGSQWNRLPRGSANQALVMIGNTPTWTTLIEEGLYSITVENPGAAEDIKVGYTFRDVAVVAILCSLVGAAGQSITWTVRYDADRSAVGTEVVTGGTTTTSVTVGDEVLVFNNPNITADQHIWIETTAKAGTVTALEITILVERNLRVTS